MYISIYRLLENEQRTVELEEEKQMYNEQAQELQTTIKVKTLLHQNLRERNGSAVECLTEGQRVQA